MDQDDIDAINATLLANAAKPEHVSVDGNSVSQHDLDSQIKAATFIAGQVAADRPHFGLRFTQLVPPGCG